MNTLACWCTFSEQGRRIGMCYMLKISEGIVSGCSRKLGPPCSCSCNPKATRRKCILQDNRCIDQDWSQRTFLQCMLCSSIHTPLLQCCKFDRLYNTCKVQLNRHKTVQGHMWQSFSRKVKSFDWVCIQQDKSGTVPWLCRKIDSLDQGKSWRFFSIEV